ncbi:MAG: hypothetical protein KAS32_13805 [Candidatus Peribacteraceae bacterium]|nr:hypothetical protein [Candidatus Peribacteraceae bacterium]
MTSEWYHPCSKCGHKQKAVTRQETIKCDECGHEDKVTWTTCSFDGG